LRFEESKSMKVSFIGSIAYHFQDILKETMSDNGLTLGVVLKIPAEGLIRYYGK